jgi:hypothetical protein
MLHNARNVTLSGIAVAIRWPTLARPDMLGPAFMAAGRPGCTLPMQVSFCEVQFWAIITHSLVTGVITDHLYP